MNFIQKTAIKVFDLRAVAHTKDEAVLIINADSARMILPQNAKITTDAHEATLRAVTCLLMLAEANNHLAKLLATARAEVDTNQDLYLNFIKIHQIK